MRTLTIFIVCMLAMSVTASQADLKTTLTNLVNMKARSVDAVQSALDLLNSLKQQNIDAQIRHDALNQTQEAEHGAQIADFTRIADLNKAAGEEATATVKRIQEEMRVTNEYLVWINNRRNEINRKREEFREQRCYASLMFVKKLKEHDEALEVIRWLREDILGVIENHEAEDVDFTQISSSADKLKAYAHLFTANQMKEFAALSDNEAQEVDPETAEWDDNATDNQRGNLELERQTAGTEQRSLGSRILDMVDKLEKHLEASMQNLKDNEIKASWDLVRWLQSTEVELVHLDTEQEVNTVKFDKLSIAIVGAKAREDKQWEIYFESAATLNDAIAVLEELRAYYAQEKERRNEENALLDSVIAIFVERVNTIDKNMRNKVNDHAEDGKFDDSDISRRVDSFYSNDFGSLGDNVAAESRQ